MAYYDVFGLVVTIGRLLRREPTHTVRVCHLNYVFVGEGLAVKSASMPARLRVELRWNAKQKRVPFLRPRNQPSVASPSQVTMGTLKPKVKGMQSASIQMIFTGLDFAEAL